MEHFPAKASAVLVTPFSIGVFQMVSSSALLSDDNHNKRQFSRPRQWLIERCQYINFGSVTFHVRGGEPDLV